MKYFRQKNVFHLCNDGTILSLCGHGPRAGQKFHSEKPPKTKECPDCLKVLKKELKAEQKGKNMSEPQVGDIWRTQEGNDFQVMEVFEVDNERWVQVKYCDDGFEREEDSINTKVFHRLIKREEEVKTDQKTNVTIDLTGDDVATAIDAWLVAQGIRINGPRTIRVNGQLCESGQVIVDPSNSINP